MTYIALDSWQTEAIRASCITKEPVTADVQELWEQIFEKPPEETASRLSNTLRIANGAFGNGLLEMRIRFNRIDWVMTPQEPPISKIPSLGPAQEAHMSLAGAITEWLNSESTPSIVRLAFCPAYFIPAESNEESSRFLKEFLAESSNLFKDAQDILVRLNYQTTLKAIPDIILNRISTTSTTTVQIISTSQESATPNFIDRSLFKVEIDVNTAANRSQEIPKERLEPTFSELIAVAGNILLRGNAP